MYQIRPANHSDLNTLLDFEQKIIETERPMDPTIIQDKPISYYPLADYLSDDNTQILVAEIDGQIVGSVYGQIRPRKDFFKTTHLGYIGFMYVRKVYRGRGLSQLLIESIRKWFQKKNILEVILHVYAKNPRAIRAYEKSGFESHLIEMRFNPDK